MELKTHTITLRGERVTLRPMTEADWPHRLALPLQGQIQEIGLIEMRPVRHLCQWPLSLPGQAAEKWVRLTGQGRSNAPMK